MKKMTPRSKNSLQHLAAFILKFLNTSVQFLGSNSNDGALKAENVMHFRVHTPVIPTSARLGLSLCFHSDFTRINMLTLTLPNLTKSHKNYLQNTQHMVLRNRPTLIIGTERLACLNSPPGVQLGTLA